MLSRTLGYQGLEGFPQVVRDPKGWFRVGEAEWAELWAPLWLETEQLHVNLLYPPVL